MKRPEREYERGENRKKHVGRTPEPEVIFEKGESVGKCPARFPPERRDRLLREAVPHLVLPPYSQAFPKRLYAVDEDGTIYTGQISTPGRSYHGYPYHGRLGKRLIAALRLSARSRGCESRFDDWIRSHITVGGPPDL